MSEQGIRLNVRKATLREWPREFARHLQVQGIAANATETVQRPPSFHSASEAPGSPIVAAHS